MTYFYSPVITDWQKQIIMGTILGGSSIVKPKKGRNSYLFMRSCDEMWLEYKSQELKNFASQKPFTKEGRTLRWHSNCFPIFNEFRELFYEDDVKTVKMAILDKLRDIGLAIWYGDCGKIKKNNVIINTHKFGEKGTGIINDYFNQIGIESEITKEKNNYRILMSEAGSVKFLATIGHRLPTFMI